MARFRCLAVLIASLQVFSSAPALAWEVNSSNSMRDGQTASATTFWIERFGPATLRDLATVPLGENDYWAVLSILCMKGNPLSPVVHLNLLQAGSDHRKLEKEFQESVDDPGFVDFVFDKRVKKRFRTSGVLDDYVSFSKDQGLKLVREILRRKSLRISVRPAYEDSKISVEFDVSNLSRHKLRFLNAGCRF